MIRFLGNKYTREQILALRNAIDVAYTDIFCASTCVECRYYRPCHDLANLLKHLDDILNISEN